MKDAAEGRPSAAGWRPSLVALGAAAAAAMLLAFALPGLHPAGRIAGIVLAAAIGAGAAFQARRRPAVARAGAWVSALYLAALSLAAVIRWSWEWLPTDPQELQELLERNRSAAVWIYFAVCFLQPVALPLPEALTVMTGSAVLDAFTAFVAGFAGTILGIFSMFALVRFGGRKLVARLANPEQLDRYHRYVARNEVLILVALFVIPILPDEIICVGAGLSGVSAGRFALIAALSKLLTSFTLAYSIQLGVWLSLTPMQILLIVGTIALAVIAFPRVMRLVRRGEAARRAAGAGRGNGREAGGSETGGNESAGGPGNGTGSGNRSQAGAAGETDGRDFRNAAGNGPADGRAEERRGRDRDGEVRQGGAPEAASSGEVPTDVPAPTEPETSGLSGKPGVEA